MPSGRDGTGLGKREKRTARDWLEVTWVYTWISLVGSHVFVEGGVGVWANGISGPICSSSCVWCIIGVGLMSVGL